MSKKTNKKQTQTGTALDHVQLLKLDQPVTMTNKATTVSLKNETISIDPNLLFQRLIIVAKMTPNLLPTYFEFELTSVPTAALCDQAGLSREAKKHELAKYIWDATKHELKTLPEGVHYVLDSGALLYVQGWNFWPAHDFWPAHSRLQLCDT